MYSHEGEQKYKSTTVTKEITLDDVISHVNLLQPTDIVRLSLVDVEYLDTDYFSCASTSIAAASDDDGRRVQLVLSRSGRLRRAVTFATS